MLTKSRAENEWKYTQAALSIVEMIITKIKWKNILHGYLNVIHYAGPLTIFGIVAYCLSLPLHIDEYDSGVSIVELLFY